MDSAVPNLRADNTVPILLSLFFLSGATALAYQILWMRELQLVFGTSTLAISTVLASFMAGLGAGGCAIARFADRIRRPLAAYGFLELGIGVYALVFPVLLDAATALYSTAWLATTPSPTTFAVFQFGLVVGLLLVPTMAMGATLPLLVRFATRRIATAGERVGTLYAVNTFGAVAGVWVCGFWLLPRAGLLGTTVTAATANLLLGLAVLVLNRRVAGSGRVVERNPRDAGASGPVVAVGIAIGLAGFSALVYEVSWTRLLALMLGSSAYTFSVMLITFLVGIALGGKLGGPLADHLLRTGGLPRVLYAFATLEIGIAMLAYATMYSYSELPFWYVRLFDEFAIEQRPEVVWWVSLFLAGLVMTPPAVLMGMHFPVAARAVLGTRNALGRAVGILYGANALGGAAGAFVAGFVLLPGLGIQGTVLVAAGVGLIAAGVLALRASRGRARLWVLAPPIALAGLALLFVNARPPWSPLLMTAGMYHYVSKFEDHSREGILRYSVDLYDLVFYEEGLSSVVTVAQNRGSSHRWLAINGKVDASTTDDMPTQVLLPLLPMQFAEAPEDVLVIGLASGVTAGAAALLPEIERLQIVELEPAIGRAAQYFGEWNHAVLSDPRVELVYNDGRNHLLRTARESYDIVVSEPSNPWISGVANLFTREFLELGKSRLKPGGVWSQWVPVYGMDSDDLRSILKTFGEVYPFVIAYATIENADLVLVGSESPLYQTESAAARLFDRPELTAELARVNIDSAIALTSLFLMDRAGIAALVEDAPVNTDDNMWIEFSTATKLHTQAELENFALLLEHASVPEAGFEEPLSWANLARIYGRRGDAMRASAAMSRVAQRED